MRTTGAIVKGWQGAGSQVTQRTGSIPTFADNPNLFVNTAVRTIAPPALYWTFRFDCRTTDRRTIVVISYLKTNILEFGQPISHKCPKLSLQRGVFGA
jgi:hypothetical protein